MAPRGASTWRRPYTSIYNDNYRYGTGLYSDTLSDIEKRYSESISKTKLRSDRPDLAFTTFSGSNLASSTAPAGDSGKESPGFSRQYSPSPMREITRSPNFESRLNATLKSAACALDEDVQDVINSRIEKRRQQALAKSDSESVTDSSSLEKRIQQALAKNESEDTIENRIEKRMQQALAKSETEDMITSRIEKRRQQALAKSETEDTIASRIEKRRQQALARSESEDVMDSKIEKRRQALARSESHSEVKKSIAKEESSRPKSLYDDASLWSLTKTSGKIQELDLDIPKPRRKAGGRQTPTNGPSSPQWRNKSRDLQDQVDSLEKSMSDTSNRLKNELSSIKAKYHTEISDLSSSVETTSEQANELQKVCKRQASQLQELQSAYNSTERNIEDALEEMTVWQNKCKSLKKEMDRLREEVEQAAHKSSKA